MPMVKLNFISSFRPALGGADSLEVEAKTLRELMRILVAKYPRMPLSADLLQPQMWVAEIVYFPLETELLRAAKGIGCRALDGSGMAVFQAVEAFRLFTGVTANAGRMRRHFTSIR